MPPQGASMGGIMLLGSIIQRNWGHVGPLAVDLPITSGYNSFGLSAEEFLAGFRKSL